MPNRIAHWKAFKPVMNRGKVNETWKTRQILAFPVHTDSPGHWTLGIAVNKKWGILPSVRPEIEVFHLDSLPHDEKHREIAEQFARHAFQLTKDDECQVIEVAVPYQPFGSNDCGLYPAHFLKIFLSDIDNGLSICRKVSRIRHYFVLYLFKFRVLYCLPYLVRRKENLLKFNQCGPMSVSRLSGKKHLNY
jgi:hypothetical protein